MGKIGISERMYAWGENLTMILVPRQSAGPIFKWLFKIPILQYKLGLGWMIGKYILLLTTKGRKSGKPRHTPVEYVYDAKNDRYRIAAGWAGNTDWYRNILADPHVTVQVGRRKFSACAERATDEEVALYMMDLSKRQPRMDQVWNRWSDRPVDGSFESYLYSAKFFPSLWLKEGEKVPARPPKGERK